MATAIEERTAGDDAPGSQEASALDQRAQSLGLPSATALVIGSIIGTGVFTMPAVMAGAGTSSLITLGIISVGALLLGVLFGQLTKRATDHRFRQGIIAFAGATSHRAQQTANDSAVVGAGVRVIRVGIGVDAGGQRHQRDGGDDNRGFELHGCL